MAAKAASEALSVERTFSPFGRTHNFQRQLHQISDAILIGIALVISYQIRRHIHFGNTRPLSAFGEYAWSYLVVVPTAMYFFDQFGLYRHARLSGVRLVGSVVASTLFATLAVFGVAFLFKEEVVLFSRMWLMLFTASATLFVVVKHVAWRRRVYRGAKTHQRRTVALLGARQQNQEIAQLIARHAEWGINVAAELDLNEYSDESLVEALHEHHVECVMLTTGKLSFDRIGQAISVCETEGVDVLLMADFVRPAIARISFDQFAQRPVLLFSCKPDRAWHLLIKRVIDFVGAACVLLIAGPLIMLPVAIAIRLTSKGPILFRQNRCGLHGKTFSMLKFRSMVVNAEELRSNLLGLNEQSGPVFKIARDPRITRLGRIIRKTSIDELPQLFNILRGDMSLVGPRPPIPSEVQKYATWQRRRLSMKPGLTCLWQVSGRNQIKFDEWMRLDLAYIDSWSLALDVRILLRTIPVVLLGHGAT